MADDGLDTIPSGTAVHRPSPETLPRGGVDALPERDLGARLEEARRRTLWLVEPVCDEDLDRVHDTLLSPLAWDLGHIAAFSDLWVARATGRDPLRPDLFEVYDAEETPGRSAATSRTCAAPRPGPTWPTSTSSRSRASSTPISRTPRTR
ncbi:MAG: DinB family protein [Thermoleophilaceae bacterium]